MIRFVVSTVLLLAATAHADERCVPPPLSEPLFLRGAPTTWALRDDMQFRYRCNAYVLNVNLHGPQEFRVTDPHVTGGISFGAAQPQALQPDRPAALAMNARANLRFDFHGEQAIRLSFRDGKPQITISAGDATHRHEPPIADPLVNSLHFDSRDGTNKLPLGAAPAGSEIQFSLDADPGLRAVTLVVEKRRLEGPQEVLEYGEVARVPLTRTGDRQRDHWYGAYRFAEIGVYGYYFLIDTGNAQYVYENNADAIPWTRELGSNGLGSVVRVTPETPIRRFRQTIFRGDYHVPEWASDTVFYYIFPERFRNGDKRNDPQPGPRTFHDKSVEVHKNWLEKPWRPHSGDGSDDLYGNDFFGGDLAGITDKLDYIHDLGANALYLTPIFSAASNHKYDTADYRNIDAHFGTNADFERLTSEAAKRGIRVILDTSLNHSGSDSIYFDRYAKYPALGAFKGGTIQPDSPYADWYHFDGKTYHGWSGAQDLPELNKASPSFREFAVGAADSVMNQWLDRGAAGWRMDVAPWVPDDFWRAWRAAVKQRHPDALTIAETQFEASKFFLGDEFDSTMNYVFRNAVQDYANGADARVAYRSIELMRDLYPPQAFYAAMNLLSTHDSARALYEFGWHNEHDDAETVARAKQRLRLAAFFQMTFPGAPAVFYGDEVGVTGGEDPFNRVTYPWADLGGKPDNELLADYKKLIKLRNDNPVLRHGSIEAPAHLDEHVIVLPRRDGDRVAIVATNNDAAAHDVNVALPDALASVTFNDALGGPSVRADGRTLALRVPPMFGSVLLAQVPKPASTAQANVHVLAPMAMPQLGRERTIRVYLPPGYEHSRKRYPVLYMHDGQNLFDVATSFLGEWGVDEALNELAKSKGLELIVVGIDNGSDKRITELTPWENPNHRQGEGREYMQFVVDTLKPYIDAHYRTKPDRDNTAIMGSSLGGLISHYAIYEYPQAFGKAGILSPAYWYAPGVAAYTAERTLPAHTRVYFYAGGKEDGEMVGNMQRVIALVRGPSASDLRVHVEPEAHHNETAWRAEFPRAVEWLFGKK
jgi:glycosidase/predicted alpha/beta superfamily hydrolase